MVFLVCFCVCSQIISIRSLIIMLICNSIALNQQATYATHAFHFDYCMCMLHLHVFTECTHVRIPKTQTSHKLRYLSRYTRIGGRRLVARQTTPVVPRPHPDRVTMECNVLRLPATFSYCRLNTDCCAKVAVVTWKIASLLLGCLVRVNEKGSPFVAECLLVST